MTNHISENYSDITQMLNQEVLGFVEVRGVRFILMDAIKDNVPRPYYISKGEKRND